MSAFSTAARMQFASPIGKIVSRYETFDLFSSGSLTANHFSSVMFLGVDDGEIALTFLPDERIWSHGRKRPHVFI